MRELGINVRVKTLDPDQAHVNIIRQAGFTKVFSSPPQLRDLPHLPELVHAAGLEFETLHAPFNHMNDIWLPEDNGMLSELLDTVDKCVEVNAPIAVVHLSSGMTPPPPTDLGRERFIRLVEYAAKKSVKIAFENQRMLGNISWAFEEFQNTDEVGFCWDCGHEGCFTPGREYMPLFGHRLICTHIHDNNQIFNQDLHRLPFDGTIDFSRVAHHLRTSGYTGPLTLEIKGMQELYTPLTAEEFFHKAAESLRRLDAMIQEA